MPIQTLMCPQCARSVVVDIPPETRAQLEHRESGVDIVRVTPRVSPVQAGPTRTSAVASDLFSELRQRMGRTDV